MYNLQSLWSPYGIGQTIIFLPCGFFFLLFSSSNLSRRRLDVCHTSTRGVALVRISDAGLKRAAWLPGNAGRKKSLQKLPSGHYRTNLSGYIFATKARIVNRKKLVKRQYVLQMSPQYGEFGPLAAEIGPVVWGTPANFKGFRVLAALLHGSQVVGVSQTLRR